MKKNKKLILSAVAVMSLVAIAVTTITFSFAALNGKKAAAPSSDLALAEDAVDSGKNIIDYIVENSYKDDAAPYRVVEIGPVDASGKTDFETFVTGGSLKDNVFNAYKTIETDFNPEGKRIEYKYYSTKTINGASRDVPTGKETSPYDDILAYITGADFIYVTNDATETYDPNKGNDISEELYDLLHTYAVGKYNPLVIENPNASTSSDIGGPEVSNTTFGKVVADTFAKKGSAYKTYQWNNTLTADTFLNGALGSGSRYTGINGSTRAKYWQNVAISEVNYKMSDVLVVSAAGGELFTANTLNYKLLEDVVSGGVITKENTAAWDTPITLGTNQGVVKISIKANDETAFSTKFSKLVYKSRYVVPNFVRFTEVSLNDYLNLGDLSSYDMVIFETSCKPTEFADASSCMTKMTELMASNKHVIYSSELVDTTTTTTTPSTGKVTNDTNYKELYYLVATQDAVSRYQNVMVTEKAMFNLIINSNNSETCKPIADLINKAAFRGIGGPGSSSSTFTVLEVQPCYPVDKDVAKVVGDTYYTIPSELVNNKTKEQIGYEKVYDADGNLTEFTINGEKVTKNNAIEYYEWELSEANIAEALSMNANQIRVVHMSTEELATSKAAILGTYDMIYFGGNISAKRSTAEYTSICVYTWGDTVGQRLENKMELMKGLPIYSMYSHNGDFVQLRGGSTFVAGNLTAITPYTGSAGDTFGMYNGNDITYDMLQTLKAYVDAGLPVIFDNKLNDAYQYIANTYDADGKKTEETYKQNAIDPDSNICKFLDYCASTTKNGTAGAKGASVKGLKNTILWGFDQAPRTLTDNNDGQLGDTATGYVSVFADGTNKDNLVKVYKDSNKRAKLALTSMPPVYNLYDASTKLEDKVLKFEFDVTGTDNYEVKFYTDYNLDGDFGSGEQLPCTVDLNKGTLKCDLASADSYGPNFYGPVYWKFEVIDKNTGSVVSTTNIAYIKAKPGTDKQKINVLQIIPVDVGSSNATGRQGNVNLMFCTKCQRALSRLEYNPYSDQGFNYNTYYDFHLFDAKAKNGYFNQNGGSKVWIGKHEHQFGIVKYDSSMKYEGAPKAGMDDWDDNFADEVSDLYDFDIDILTSRELEAVSKEVRDEAAAKLAAYPEFDGKTLDTLTDEEKESFKNILLGEANTKYGEYLATLPAVNDAKDALDAALKQMMNKCDQIGTANALKVKGYFKRILDESYYEDYYVFFFGRNELYVDSTDPEWQYGKYTPLYETYAKALDAKIEAKEAYNKAKRIASYDNWMYECYQALILGPAEDFNNDDINTKEALDDIEMYILSGGTTIVFHTIISVYDKPGAGNQGPLNLSKRIRGLIGMNKNHLEVDTAKLGGNATPHYIPYKAETVNNVDGTVTKYDPKKYYFMNLSYKLLDDANTYFAWDQDIAKSTSQGSWDAGIAPNKYLTNEAFTNTAWVEISGYGGANPTPYIYSKYNHMSATTYARAEAELAKRGTDRASQCNKGIVTMYPFTLSDELNISGTHAQAYALDIEDSSSTVWYAFGGGSNNLGDFHKDQSSIYAASPRDGADSYFVYSYGSVYYCGAGHSEITGMGKDNNDERRLYINMICNSVTNEGYNALDVYDYQKETNDKVVVSKAVDYDYTYKMDADASSDEGLYPEFSFNISTAKGNSVSGIKVYYDYGDKGTSEIVDYQYNSDIGMYDAPKSLDSPGASLKLDTSKLINNKYAYIVIEVKTAKGGTLKKTIKVMINSTLFDLT